MLKKIAIAKKVGMTQVYHRGEMVAATVLQVEKCKVKRILGGGVEIATGDESGRWVSRAVAGEGQVGEQQDLAFVTSAAALDVIGTSKGRGFSGVIRKHGFSGLGASHGVKKVHRSGGSVGQNTEPGRVHPGTKMAGRHGGRRVTVRNLAVVSYSPETAVLVLAGAVPGARNCRVLVREQVES